MRTIKLLLAVLFSVALASCGGGGGSTAPSTMISGTAAAGAPVIGYVSVRDSSTNAQPVKTNIPIHANGNYSVDVAGLKAPFAFLASGTVGGKTVSLYSAATSADVGGTINITPFTDLVIRNVAATAVDTYINSGAFSTLTAAQIDAKRVALTNQLAPALTAMGVSGSIDLLRATFNADGTGLDRFMDVVQVSTTPTTATITNILDAANTLVINTSAGGTTTDTLGVAGLTTSATPVDGMMATMNAFSAFFATSLPSPSNANLLALFAPSFLDNGRGAGAFLTEVTTSQNIVGLKFANVSVDSVNAASGVAQVSFVPTSATGVNLSKNNKAEQWQMKKNATTGIWQLDGNQMVADVSIRTNASKQVCTGQTVSGCSPASTNYQTGLSIYIDNKGAQPIGSALVTGPGLPNGGLNLVAQTNQTWFAITNTDIRNFGGNNNWNMSDASIGSVAANSTYTVVIYNNASPPVAVSTSTYVVPVAPVLNTQLAALAFPSIGGMVFTGGAMSMPLTWSIPTGLTGDTLQVNANQTTGTNATVNVYADLTATPTATGTTTLVITAPPSGMWTNWNYWINALDQYGGGINTSYY